MRKARPLAESHTISHEFVWFVLYGCRAQREEIEAKLQEKQRWKDKLQHRSTTVAANLGGAGVRRSDTSAGGRHGVNSLPRPESPQGPRRFRQSYSAGDRDNHIMATAAQHGQQTSGSLAHRAAVEMVRNTFAQGIPHQPSSSSFRNPCFNSFLTFSSM